MVSIHWLVKFMILTNFRKIPYARRNDERRWRKGNGYDLGKKSNLEGPRELFREIPLWKPIYRYK